MSQINFVTEFNSIFDRARKECLSASERLLWMTLFYLANDRATMTASNIWDWPDDFFKVDNAELFYHCPLDIRTILKARNRLKQLGVIDFIPGKRNSDPPKYRINYLSAFNVDCKNATNHATNNAINHATNHAINHAINHDTNHVNISINKDIDTGINQNEISARTLAPDDELRLRQDDHDQIFDLWTKCGWKLPEVFMDELISLYSQFGLDKLLTSIRITADASPEAPMQYLRKVITGTGRPAATGKTGKRVSAQNFSQRQYDDGMDEMDRMMMNV